MVQEPRYCNRYPRGKISQYAWQTRLSDPRRYQSEKWAVNQNTLTFSKNSSWNWDLAAEIDKCSILVPPRVVPSVSNSKKEVRQGKNLFFPRSETRRSSWFYHVRESRVVKSQEIKTKKYKAYLELVIWVKAWPKINIWKRSVPNFVPFFQDMVALGKLWRRVHGRAAFDNEGNLRWVRCGKSTLAGFTVFASLIADARRGTLFDKSALA